MIYDESNREEGRAGIKTQSTPVSGSGNPALESGMSVPWL
jgi:hypothetical protein